MEEIRRYFFNIPIMEKSLPFLLHGLWITLAMAVLIIILGIAAGLALAALRSFRFPAVNIFILVFVDVFRAVPALVILMLIYFGLPAAGIVLSPFVSAVAALALVLAAFSEEIFWAGITAVDKGQWDAARSTGLGFGQTLRLVILAQAVKMVIPPLTNRTIAITKNTAIASAVSVAEILNQASSQQALLANPTPLTVGALLYVGLFLPFTILSRWLERRYAWST
jgi:polar amino acid transport system permease protein